MDSLASVPRFVPSAPQLSVILPVFNGASSLAGTLTAIDAFVSASTRSVEIVFVDDGSVDATVPLLEQFAATRPWVTLVCNGTNQGKGAAVSAGMLAARGAYRVFTDSDLAYPIGNVLTVLEALEAGSDVVVANRMHPETRFVVRPQHLWYHGARYVVGRVLNWVVRQTLIPTVHDTQAGLKGFTAQAATRIFSRTTIKRFAFDIEVLLLASRFGMQITEVAVELRDDRGATTVRFAQDTFAILRDVLGMAQRVRSGFYDVATVPVLVTPAPTPAVAPMTSAANDGLGWISWPDAAVGAPVRTADVPVLARAG